MKKEKNPETSWAICKECKGEGKKSRGLSNKAKLHYKIALDNFENSKHPAIPPVPAKGHLYTCLNCKGSGLIVSNCNTIPDQKSYPHIAIIGAGIGGVALAVACLHRGIPFTIYERDSTFDLRSQGYGLTLQQASKAIEGLGIGSLKEGVISTKHLVHDIEGKVLGEWGIRKWLQSGSKKTIKRTNIHIARQSLRLALLEQLGGQGSVQWGCQLVHLKELEDQKVTLRFEVQGKIKNAKADIVVGADGIRSKVRNLLIGEATTPLQYLECIVILGICPLNAIDSVDRSLLDSSTVFQTANGNERIYIMPYTTESVMWQLSFPILEEQAKILSMQGPKALKEEACRRTNWHDPIPQIIKATSEKYISGYPVYDREVLNSESFIKAGPVTLIGDAAHPMSPFKGQGANQALLDALSLARTIVKECNSYSGGRKTGLRETVLNKFEMEMLNRSASKVKDSAAAAQFLHSEIVLQEGDFPRKSSVLKK